MCRVVAFREQRQLNTVKVFGLLRRATHEREDSFQFAVTANREHRLHCRLAHKRIVMFQRSLGHRQSRLISGARHRGENSRCVHVGLQTAFPRLRFVV